MPKVLKIGKSPDNDVVFHNATVSRNHALLTVADDRQHAHLRDLGSTNGTFVNNVRITQDTNIDLTSQLRFGTESTTLSAILSKVKPAVVNKPQDPNSRLIGRNDSCQIVMHHDDVSSRHAILTKRSDGTVCIEDCGSTNGTFVNGERITSRVLHKGDRVTITRNYPLDWERTFPAKTTHGVTKVLPIAIAATVAAVVIAVVGIFMWTRRAWDSERIYKEYNSAVCWVYSEYGYRVLLDGDDITPDVCSVFGIEQASLVHVEGKNLKPGVAQAQGTAFFISEDGKLATNLHVTRPWLFDSNTEALESSVNKLVTILAQNNPMLTRSTVKVEGVLTAIYIVPNGLPVTNGNAVGCNEIKAYDDTDRDVAIIQTETRSLPSSVKSIVNLNNAATSDEAIREGMTVFSIGFPYGTTLALNSNQELKNQVHKGTVTQTRGEYEFGHDAATAGGASGSPMFNDKGQLIGIHHAGMTGVTGAQGFNMAIKAKYIIDLLK